MLAGGPLTLSVAGSSVTLSVAGSSVTLPAVANGAVTSGALNAATVSDLRGTNAGWSLVGQAGDFTAPELAPLPAGGSRTLRIVVPLDGPLYGRFAVHGQFQVGAPGDAAAPGVAFVAEAERYPWGWAAVAGGLILILLVRQFVGLARDRRLSS